MKQPRRDPLFLERQVYQRRRFGDAAKFLPVLGICLFLLPILWASSARTAGSGVYLFAVWAALICIVAIVSRRLLDGSASDLPEPPSHEGEAD